MLSARKSALLVRVSELAHSVPLQLRELLWRAVAGVPEPRAERPDEARRMTRRLEQV